ncbi:hypothetical protein conserved [Leishmania donovani]|uniref:Uncharacterized protein n=4 Tax=Leishmania donovani species complex TaxID=38574 RepID=A4ICF5_LEIIN|nr:conserved hypothetical protein [Leishmania infantum JPCM5]XP_003865377.1 hypothetical protein, conserved [Leishmania donovani]CAC9550455.1 hypothetical_protein_-_conserved [Leishmania infantum]AYU83612.1 hypothetical protein LdCL_360032200 [Leishmania donovani]CAJ1993628.1 hypothetical protein conserved [Leishmania donovani]CAM72533.1 conserved hypothetical protein [Leishmania infantum JPCM5]CBZ38700.1 hypothetical protein, conserved [Leishmania donovani]|eukprot:XP_001469424.1 conserved hypothetical protein [Leishmania infantum JPCM5]
MPIAAMLTKDADCEKSQQQKLEEDIKSPCTPSFHCISDEDPKSDRATNYSCAKPLDWSPQTPETPPVSVAELRVTAVADTSVTETTSESVTHRNELRANEGESSASGTVEKPFDGVAAAGGAAPAAVPQKAQERGSSEPLKPKRSYGTSDAVSSSSCHVDALGDLAGSVRQHHPTSTPTLGTSGSNGGGDATKHAVAAGHVDGSLPPPLSGVFFPSTACDAVTTASLVTLISSYCDVVTLVQLMRVNRSAHLLATSDAVWKPLLVSMNLPPLLAAYERDKDYYDFFVEDVITTRALHGHYTFQAANAASGSRESVSTTSGSRSAVMNRDYVSRDEDSLQDDIFNIASLQLLISAASLGQSNHLIGRVQLLLTYKNESMEVLQGSCRFSVHRRCFSLCCSAFGTVKRGPVFTVAVATVTKPWANEGFQHFSEHKNGIRLVMTPVLWEGQSPGSQITENDILVVSRPKPAPSLITSTTGSAAANSSLDAPTASRG